MTDRSPLGRMAQPFGDMHHNSDAHRRRQRLWHEAARALFWVGLSLLIVLATRALGVAATMQPPVM